jgi:DNA replication protein DnaC
MTTLSIKECTTMLRLPYIKRNYQQIIKEATANELSYEDFLNIILNNEVSERNANSIQKKIRYAKFPNKFTLDDFKLDHLSVQIKQKIKQLSTLEFINNNENIILVGNPGTGKTALSIGLGMKACLEGLSVLFISVPQLLIEISEAMSNSEYIRYKRKFEKYDLVILDELGYTSFSKDAGEILFNLLSSRNESGSIIITSNLTMDKWNEVFKDTVLTGAIVDRLANKAHMIDMSGESYRIRQTKEWMNKNEK